MRTVVRDRKRKSRKKLTAEERTQDAARWLRSTRLPAELVCAYSKRYAVSKDLAIVELMGIGRYDEICIQGLEARGISWEYRYEALTDRMYVVPEGTEDWELYSHHSLF